MMKVIIIKLKKEIKIYFVAYNFIHLMIKEEKIIILTKGKNNKYNKYNYID